MVLFFKIIVICTIIVIAGSHLVIYSTALNVGVLSLVEIDHLTR